MEAMSAVGAATRSPWAVDDENRSVASAAAGDASSTWRLTTCSGDSGSTALAQRRSLAEDVGRHRPCAGTRTDRVRPNSIAAQRLRGRQRQRRDTGFARTIVGLSRRAGQPRLRGG